MVHHVTKMTNQEIATQIIADIAKVRRGVMTLQELEEAIEGNLAKTDAKFPAKLKELADSLVPRIYLHDHGTGAALVSPPQEYTHHRNEGFEALFEEVAVAMKAYLAKA